MFEPEFERKLLRSARSKPSSSDFYTVEKAEFVETFRRIAMPKGLTHLFFVEGGAVAVENAMKAAFDWKIRLNQSRGVQGERGTKIVHFKEAFHGRGGYTLSVTNTADPRKTKLFPKFDWPRITNPKLTFPRTAESDRVTIELEKKALAEIDAAFAANADDIAAILIETIQGEGGDNHFRTEFFQALRKVCDDKEAMLILDEIQCGCGATGKFWAYEHHGIVPDMVCFGKKFQVCGIAVGPRIDAVKDNVFQEASRINSTFGGNLVDMVRAERYLEIIEKENLVQNAADTGVYFLQKLGELAARHPGTLSNVRGKGLMCAIDAPSSDVRNRIVRETYERGAIILSCGTVSIRFRPALTFQKANVDEIIPIFEEAVKAASK